MSTGQMILIKLPRIVALPKFSVYERSHSANRARATHKGKRHRPSVSPAGSMALFMLPRGVTAALFRERCVAVW
jgi:hypothetical protein